MDGSKEQPEIVYHYTSRCVLLEILRNEQLWATNIHYLNDSQERYHLMRIAIKRLAVVARDTIDSSAMSRLRTELNFRKQPNSVPFVVSFRGIGFAFTMAVLLSRG